MLFRSTGLALLAGATLLMGSHAALAQADAAAAGAAAADTSKPNPERGQKLFYTCYGCHGVENYRNAYPDYSVPKLRHQQAAYIISALNEYKSGDRPHPTMHAQASSLSDQDIKDIAAYLQDEPVKPSTGDKGSAPKQAAAASSARPETAGPRRTACRLSRTGAHRLSQRPAQERRDERHGAAADERRGHQNRRRVFREPNLPARDRDHREQITAEARGSS
jgi:cytochrome c553